MPAAPTLCPNIDHFRLFLSGQMTAAQADTLITHLESCDACARQAAGLADQDSLIELVRQSANPPDTVRSERLTELMQRLRQQYPAATHSGEIDKTLPPSSPPPTNSSFSVRATAPGTSLTFRCSNCQKPLKVSSSLAGKKVKCAHCQQVMQAPTLVPDNSSERTLPPSEAHTPAPAKSGSVVLGQPVNTQLAETAEEKDRELLDFLAPPQAPDELGRLGPYRVLKILGAGGMGVVYMAEDPQLKRLVALKAMLPSLGASVSARKRFLREAQTAAALKHDHIVTIHQVGEDRGAPFLAMEFLQGESLDDRLKRESKLPLPEVLRIGREMAEGMEAAHEAGLIHRDIKPANVWLETRRAGGVSPPTGPANQGANAPRSPSRVKLLDFGLARAASEEAHLTQSGAIVGTPAYMAPEQAKSKKVDYRCDLFSLGVVLYRLCTGEIPFKGDDTISTLMAVATIDPPPPSALSKDVPKELSDLVMELLAKDPAARPASARAVVERLEALAHPPATPERADRVSGRSKPRRRLPLAAAAVLLILLPLAYFFGGTVIRIATNKGELVIETSDPNIEVTVKDGSATVYDKVKDRRFILSAGDYEVEVREVGGGLGFATKKFTITRGGTETFHARLETPLAKLPDQKQNQQPPPQAKKDPIDPPEVKKDPPTPPEAKKVPMPPSEVKNDPVKPPVVKPDLPPPNENTLQPLTALGPARATLAGHPLAIRSLAFSSDGKTLASAGDDATIKLWDVDSGKEKATLKGHEKFTSVLSVAFSRDGKTLASGGFDHTIRLWDVAGGKEKNILKGHDDAVNSVALSGDGKTLASGSNDGTIKLWDLATGQAKTTLKAHGRVTCVAFSRDGKMLASCGLFGIKLWDAASGLEKSDLKGHKTGIFAVAFSGDGKTLVSGAADGTKLWDVASGLEKPNFKANDGNVLAVAISGDGKTAASGYGNAPPRLWDVASGQLKAVLEGHNGAYVAVAFSDDSKLLAAGDLGGTIRLWNVAPEFFVQGSKPNPAANKPLAKQALVQNPAALKGALSWTILPRLPISHPGVPIALIPAFSPDGRWLACADSCDGNGYIRLWDTSKGVLAKVIVLPDNNGGPFKSLGFSHDSKLLAVSGQNRQVNGLYRTGIVVLEIATGKELTFLEGGHFCWAPRESALLTLPQSQVQAQDFAVCTFGPDKISKRYYPNPDSDDIQAAWSPDGTKRAVLIRRGQKNSEIKVWDVAAKKVIATKAAAAGVHPLFGQPGFTPLLVWSGDSKLLAFVGAASKAFYQDGKQDIHVWDVMQDKIVAVENTVGMGDCLFTTKNLGSGSGLATSKEIAPDAFLTWIKKPSSNTALCVLSADGLRYVEVTKPRPELVVKIGDTVTGKELHRLIDRIAFQSQFAISPDGASFVCESVGKYEELPSRAEKSVADWTIWDFKQAKVLHNIKTPRWGWGVGSRCAWSPNGKLLAFAGRPYYSLAVVDRETGKQLVEGNPPYLQNPQGLAWTADSGKLVVAAAGQKPILWDIATQDILQTFPDQVVAGGSSGPRVFCSPDGAWIASVSSDRKRLQIWNARDYKLAKVVELPGNGWEFCCVPSNSRFPADRKEAWPTPVFECFSQTLGGNGLTISSCGRLSQQVVVFGRGKLFWSLADGQPAGSLVILDQDKWFAVSADGHVHGTPGIENDLVYIVQTAQGQESLSAAEFAKRFSWQNDPNRARQALTANRQP